MAQLAQVGLLIMDVTQILLIFNIHLDEMPGVYTKVSYFYDWILRTLAKEEGLADDESETGD